MRRNFVHIFKSLMTVAIVTLVSLYVLAASSSYHVHWVGDHLESHSHPFSSLPHAASDWSSLQSHTIFLFVAVALHADCVAPLRYVTVVDIPLTCETIDCRVEYISLRAPPMA